MNELWINTTWVLLLWCRLRTKGCCLDSRYFHEFCRPRTKRCCLDSRYFHEFGCHDDGAQNKATLPSYWLFPLSIMCAICPELSCRCIHHGACRCCCCCIWRRGGELFSSLSLINHSCTSIFFSKMFFQARWTLNHGIRISVNGGVNANFPRTSIEIFFLRRGTISVKILL